MATAPDPDLPAPTAPTAPGAPEPAVPEPGRLVVASFNLHAGIDGWGRPFDTVAVLAGLDADLIAVQEDWIPDDGPGLAATAAAALGYTVFEHSLAHGRLAGPHPRADHRWMRPLDWRGSSHAIYLDDNRPLGPRTRRSARFVQARPGRWGIAVLSRLPVTDHRVVTLEPLPRDRSGRGAVVVRVDAGGRPVTVVGTHMSHLSYGSPRHYRALGRRLREEVGDGPAVLAGDMNLWGPPVGILLGDWRRTVKGRTWPAWRPHSQVDHILVRGSVRVLGGEVLPMAGSDHRPVRVALAVPADPP
ncbi:MAG TPA: endonuclease/exonuclease/phosphatase family protein [Acidimicrobiales bacterium]|nr:endonuclease/exonuclease/phosphatase family protein [Acidimicrobiales bacterium]